MPASSLLDPPRRMLFSLPAQMRSETGLAKADVWWIDREQLTFATPRTLRVNDKVGLRMELSGPDDTVDLLATVLALAKGRHAVGQLHLASYALREPADQTRFLAAMAEVNRAAFVSDDEDVGDNPLSMALNAPDVGPLVPGAEPVPLAAGDGAVSTDGLDITIDTSAQLTVLVECQRAGVLKHHLVVTAQGLRLRLPDDTEGTNGQPASLSLRLSNGSYLEFEGWLSVPMKGAVAIVVPSPARMPMAVLKRTEGIG